SDGFGTRAIGVLEGKAVPALAELEDAQRAVVTLDRDREAVAIGRGVADGAGRAAHQRLLAERLARREDELLPFGIIEQQGEPLGGGDALDRLEHRPDQLAEVEGRRHGPQARVELLELAEPIGETTVPGHAVIV